MRAIELLVRTFLTMNISDVPLPPTTPKWNGTNDYPYYVSIQTTNYEEGFHTCSGVLVDPSWVLTVAHCIQTERPYNIWVVVGERNLYEDKSKGDYHKVDFYVKHPDFLHYRKPYVNDVALVHLKSPVTLNEYVQTFNIKSDRITGPCKDIQWTEKRPENVFSLKKSSIIYKGNDFCHQYFINVSNCEQNFCGEKEIIDKECETSAGNVLECTLVTGEKNAVGLASWVDSCEKPQKPIVYVRISFFASWIKNVIEGPIPRGKNVIFDNGNGTPVSTAFEIDLQYPKGKTVPPTTESTTSTSTSETPDSTDDEDDDDGDDGDDDAYYWGF